MPFIIKTFIKENALRVTRSNFDTFKKVRNVIISLGKTAQSRIRLKELWKSCL